MPARAAQTAGAAGEESVFQDLPPLAAKARKIPQNCYEDIL